MALKYTSKPSSLFSSSLLVAVLLIVALLTTGCVTTIHPSQPQPGEKEWQPTTRVVALSQPIEAEPTDGSLIKRARLLTMFEDRRAYNVGDILTVILNEQTQSSKTATTDIGKNSNLTGQYNATFPNFDESASFGFGADRNFNGRGSASQKNALQGAISVTISEVTQSGALVIRGEKWIQLNQGNEYIRLTGLVRVDDVDQSNRISSQRIADARITYSGTGALAEAQSQGWLTRFFNSGWTPF